MSINPRMHPQMTPDADIPKKSASGDTGSVQRPYTPHIDRGPGFTHSDPAEECGCRFIGGNDAEASNGKQ